MKKINIMKAVSLAAILVSATQVSAATSTEKLIAENLALIGNLVTATEKFQLVKDEVATVTAEKKAVLAKLTESDSQNQNLHSRISMAEQESGNVNEDLVRLRKIESEQITREDAEAALMKEYAEKKKQALANGVSEVIKAMLKYTSS